MLLSCIETLLLGVFLCVFILLQTDGKNHILHDPKHAQNDILFQIGTKEERTKHFPAVWERLVRPCFFIFFFETAAWIDAAVMLSRSVLVRAAASDNPSAIRLSAF